MVKIKQKAWWKIQNYILEIKLKSMVKNNDLQLGTTQVGNSKEPSWIFFQPESQSHEKFGNTLCWQVPFPQYTILHMSRRSSNPSAQHHQYIYIVHVLVLKKY